MSLFNRAEVIDQNFTRWVESGNLPEAKSEQKLSKNDILKTDLISLFESQVISRHMDFHARKLKDRGECFYTIGSSGHEGNAVFGRIFSHKDMAFFALSKCTLLFRKSKTNT